MLPMSTAAPDGSLWERLPDDLIFAIFSYLPAYSLLKASEVCKQWHRISLDEFLWRDLMVRDWKIPLHCPLPSCDTSWKQEYKRLSYHAPVVKSEVLTDHVDQVLHVSYSNNGRLFATSSKDCFIKVWTSEFPAQLKFNVNMKNLNWKYTQFSQFNVTDTLLLVSGVYAGPFNFFGEIAVFTIRTDPDSFKLLNRVRNDPFDVFGTWYNETCLISGNLLRLGHLNSSCYLWLNRAMRMPQASGEPFLRLFNFHNRNASSVRTIKVANAGKATSASKCCCGRCDGSESREAKSGDEQDRWLIFTTGTKCCSPHQIGIKRIPSCCTASLKSELPGDEESMDLNKMFHMAMSQGYMLPPPPTPHVPADLPPGDAAVPPPEAEVPDEKFDSADHLIEMHGHIIGMSLSPDHRYLYVNSRPWPEGAQIEDPLHAPPIAQEIDIHVIDLNAMQSVGVRHRAHKAYTPNDECFFIFLDVCGEYVASGAEDHHGYLWDRHFGVCLKQYHHDDVVNCVAFNPTDSEVLVTVSDDNQVKIWRSRNRMQLAASTHL